MRRNGLFTIWLILGVVGCGGGEQPAPATAPSGAAASSESSEETASSIPTSDSNSDPLDNASTKGTDSPAAEAPPENAAGPDDTDAALPQEPVVDEPVGQVPAVEEQAATVAEVGQDQEYRTWTDATGTHKKEAVYRGLKSGTVVLEGKTGERLDIPLDRLCEADQQYVRQRESGTSALSAGSPETSDPPAASTESSAASSGEATKIVKAYRATLETDPPPAVLATADLPEGDKFQIEAAAVELVDDSTVKITLVTKQAQLPDDASCMLLCLGASANFKNNIQLISTVAKSLGGYTGTSSEHCNLAMITPDDGPFPEQLTTFTGGTVMDVKWENLGFGRYVGVQVCTGKPMPAVPASAVLWAKLQTK